MDNGADVNVTASTTTTGPITPNSIRFGAASTLTLTGINTIASGGLLIPSGLGSGITISGGTLDTNGPELIINDFSGESSTINSAVGTSDNFLLIKTGDGQTVLAGVLSFHGTFYVNEGAVTLSGNNTYTGQTIIAPYYGTVWSNNAASGLGASGPSNETIVQNGGFFRLQDQSTLCPESFIISGTGNGNGVLSSFGVSPTFSGNIQLAASSALATTGTTTTFTGVISDLVNGANHDLALFRNYNASGLNTIVLTGASTYGGNTYITDGSLSPSTATSNFSLCLQGGDNRLPTGTVVTLGGVSMIEPPGFGPERVRGLAKWYG